jgi:hypothetical protein
VPKATGKCSYPKCSSGSGKNRKHGSPRHRSIQAEGAFGVIKQDYGFRQFLLRGNKKVRTEIFIVAIGYNINKLHNKIQQNRTGSQLFEKVAA